jgi:uncharacterized protein YbaA (DUF1428 family)
VKVGKRTSFPLGVKLRRGETTVFSWIMFPSRAARDRINARVMKDPRLAGMMSGNQKNWPFDARRDLRGRW